VATAEGKPEDIMKPTLDQITADSFVVKWSPPAKPNGIITHYTLYFKAENGTSWTRNSNGASLNVKGKSIATVHT